MSTKAYENGVLVDEWDEVTRIYTNYRPPQSSRPFTAEENAVADADAQAKTEKQNAETLEQELDAALDSLQVILDDTNSNINTNAAARIKDIAKALKKTIRVVNDRFEATE